MDSLLSIVQMPAGIPVGTLAIGTAGATNAALLAASILANKYEHVRDGARSVPRGADRRACSRIPIPSERAAAHENRHHRRRPARSDAGAGGLSARACASSFWIRAPMRLAPRWDASCAAPSTTAATCGTRAATSTSSRSSRERAGRSRAVDRCAEAISSRLSTRSARRRIGCTRRRCFASCGSRRRTSHRSIRSRTCEAAVARSALPGVLKTRRLGYDGRGQFVLRSPRRRRRGVERAGHRRRSFTKASSISAARSRSSACAARPARRGFTRSRPTRMRQASCATPSPRTAMPRCRSRRRSI